MIKRPDCRDCHHCEPGRGTYLCVALGRPVATSMMRDDRYECKTTAELFVPKQKYAEFDE